MNLSTTQKSVHGVVMEAFLRSKMHRPNLKKGRPPPRYWMNLLITQKSIDGRLMETLLRSVEDIMQHLVEIDDLMNLQTTQNSVDGGWMETFLRSMEDIMQHLVEMNDLMNLQTTQNSVDEPLKETLLRYLEDIITLFEELSAPRSGFICSSEVEDDEDDAVNNSDRDKVPSVASSDSFRSDRSKHSNPDFKEQSSLRVCLENQHSASTESDGRDGHTEELKDRKSCFQEKMRDGVRRLVRTVSGNNMES